MKFERMHPIPGFSNYSITENGVVFSKLSNSILEGSRNPAGYVNFRLKRDEDGHTLTVGRHRLMCMVFKPIDLDLRDLVANHLNGVKGDDRLDNLEWTSYVGNIEHAGLMGLTDKCNPFSVMCIDTGEIVKYPSVAKGCKDLKLTKDALLYRLRFDETRVFPERKQYRLGWDDRDWRINPEPEKSIAEYGSTKAVLVKNTVTGEVRRFHTLTAVSKEIKFSLGSLSKRINTGEQPWYPPHHLLKWESDESPWRDVIDNYFEYERSTCSKVVLLLDENGGRKIFLSAKDCADKLGLKHSTVLYRLNSENKPRYDGYEFHYYTTYHSVQPGSNPLLPLPLIAGTY